MDELFEELLRGGKMTEPRAETWGEKVRGEGEGMPIGDSSGGSPHQPSRRTGLGCGRFLAEGPISRTALIEQLKEPRRGPETSGGREGPRRKVSGCAIVVGMGWWGRNEGGTKWRRL